MRTAQPAPQTALLPFSIPYATLHHQRVLLREDCNVPLNAQGEIVDDTRLKRALPSIMRCIQAQARLILLSHLGRPTSHTDTRLSLACIVHYLQRHLTAPITLVPHAQWQSVHYCPPAPGHVHVWENLRYLPGETHNDSVLLQKMAANCDVFVMDAFATAHRKHASTYGLISHAPHTYLGPLLTEEIHALSPLLAGQFHHMTAVIGGAKISTKLTLLHRLLDQLKVLLVGGGMANTLLKAQGYTVGRSLYEPEQIHAAQQLLSQAKAKRVTLPLPTDVVVTPALDQPEHARVCLITDVQDNEHIVDIGPQTLTHYRTQLTASDAIIWNGPLGICEIPAYAKGTTGLGQAIANSTAYTVAGGGDTLAMIAKNQWDKTLFSYLSTGGGAFLSYLEQGTLPCITVLHQQKN